MNFAEYKEQRARKGTLSKRELDSVRSVCLRCRRPQNSCYCSHIKPFKMIPVFAILMHLNERRKKIGTGRMTHLCISNSILLEGVDFSSDDRVNNLIMDENNFCTVLYPGQKSLNIGEMEDKNLGGFFPKDKNPVIFVIDGTWSMAKKMMKLSKNLHDLPRISFTPNKISEYGLRVQPDQVCLSTVESVYTVIDILDSKGIFTIDPAGAHFYFMYVFRHMVKGQLSFKNDPDRRGYRKRAPKPFTPVKKAKKWLKRSLFFKG
jgi:DTW domain-containing protein YfiP